MLHGYSFNDIVESLGYEATITLKNKKQVQGYLYTIDPETENIVIYTDNKVQVIMSHFIQEITMNKDKPCIDTDTILHYQQDNMYTKEWLEGRRQQVIAYLQKNHIPLDVNDSAMIQVLGCARIEPPYAATSVACDNALIRKRVRDLLLDMMQHN